MTWNNWREKAVKKYPDIEQEYQALALKKSLLHFAIEQKAISFKDYLVWAQKEFQLASLKGDFKPSDKNKNIWNQWSALGPWNQSCVPFYEWDQCLYVMTLEPLSQTRIKNHQVISILSAPEKINELWNFYNNENELLLDTMSDQDDSVSLETTSENDLEMPEGFGEMLNLKSASPTSEENDFLQTLVINTPTMVLPVEPKGVSLNEPEEDAPPSTQLIDLKSINSKNSDLEDDDVPPTTQLIDLKTMATKMPVLDDEEDVPPSTQRIDLAQLGMAPSSVSQPEAVASVKAPRSFPDYYLLDALQKNFHQEIHEKLEQIFKTLRTSYQKSLVFCVNKAETECQVFKVDSSFHPELEYRAKLKEPSLFRILQKTGKSFHGAISTSKVNDDFNQKVFMGQIPENFTACPLIVDGIVVGCILSVGPASTYNPQSLSLCEELSHDFSKLLNVLYQSNKQAAS